jgi:hypothetical protein
MRSTSHLRFGLPVSISPFATCIAPFPERLRALSGTSRSAISELEYSQMQFEHLPDPKTADNELSPGERAKTGWPEWRAFIYNWILLFCGLSLIFGVGYLFAP